jgi:hypothetical protein
VWGRMSRSVPHRRRSASGRLKPLAGGRADDRFRRNPAAGPAVGEGRLSMHLRTSTNAPANRLMASWIEASVSVSTRVSKSLVRHRFRPNQEKRRAARLSRMSRNSPAPRTAPKARCPGEVAAREVGRDRRSGQEGREGQRCPGAHEGAPRSARGRLGAAGSARRRD